MKVSILINFRENMIETIYEEGNSSCLIRAGPGNPGQKPHDGSKVIESSWSVPERVRYIFCQLHLLKKVV